MGITIGEPQDLLTSILIWKQMRALHAQSCPTLCDPMDCSLPGSSVHGIFQERTLEWVAISYSRGSSQPRNWTRVSCIGSQILYKYATWESLWKQNQDTIPSELALSRRAGHAKLIENGVERNVAVSGTSLVVQWLTPLSQCRGHGIDPWWGNWGLTWFMIGPKKEKKRKKTCSSIKGGAHSLFPWPPLSLGKELLWPLWCRHPLSPLANSYETLADFSYQSPCFSGVLHCFSIVLWKKKKKQDLG